MCGIVAVISRPGVFDKVVIERGVQSLSHRGPDAAGVERVFRGDDWEVWFGHKRLSIVDLSEAGHQPLIGRLPQGKTGAIVFNGEVYNHAQLRQQLLDEVTFQGRSDTEVLLLGYLAKGPDFFRQCNAMAAAAIYDESARQVILFRDRLGKKPLYVYRSGEILAFASELKVFHALGLPLTEDPQGWAYFHWLRHLPGETSIYREVRKFRAASYATINLASADPADLVYEPYWDPFAGCRDRFDGSFDEAVEAFLELLDDATRLRLDADVPVGVFLSAGIDSSLVASSVAKISGSDTTAFIVKAESLEHDESADALQTAQQLGLGAKVLDLRREDYQRQIDKVAFHYDEPCAPLSQLPTMAIAELASRHVKVVLTGDGGDELFLGYPWLAYPQRLWSLRLAIDRWPGLNSLLTVFMRSPMAEPALYILSMLAGANRKTTASKRLLALQLLGATASDQLYESFQENWPRIGLSEQDQRCLGNKSLVARLEQWFAEYSWGDAKGRSLTEFFAMQEMVGPMRDEILVKIDRACMAYSLEGRSPLLDYRMVEFAQSLPENFKFENGVTKRLLRSACEKRLGTRVASRKKSGFGIPLPDRMPSGPTDGVRWAREFERRWKLQWRGTLGPNGE